MVGRVLVLEAEPIGSEGRRVSGWLAALGIDWSPCTLGQILSGEPPPGGARPSLLVSWAALAQLDESLGRRGGSLESLLQPFDKVCVHTFEPAIVTPELLRRVTGCTRAQAAPCAGGDSKYRVSDSHREISGAFSGLESSPVQ